MAGGMFVIHSDGQLVEMVESKYDSEDLLQGLLAKYPSLLAGDQIDPASPRRWALVRREAALPGEAGGADRWSVDHLFIDQDAVPTIIEVKRSTDTRIRREVVGQMLDYAANAVVYWPIERLRSMFEETHGELAEKVLSELSEEGGLDPEGFWHKAKTNLQAGRVRMVFVSDSIPAELRRVVEFLNAQMDPAQVLAVEIRQFIGANLKTLVPRVIGQTEEAQQKKSPSAGGVQWDEVKFFQAVQEKSGSDIAGLARKLVDWALANKLRLWWGKGTKDGSCYPIYDHNGYTFSIWTLGKLEIPLAWIKTRPFDEEQKRTELLALLTAIPDVRMPEDAWRRRPTIPLSVFLPTERLQRLLSIFDWMLAEYRQHQA